MRAVSQVSAQHDRVIASYSLLAAIGMLNAQKLGLGVTIYDPMQHYSQVRGQVGGTRTPTAARRDSHRLEFRELVTDFTGVSRVESTQDSRVIRLC